MTLEELLLQLRRRRLILISESEIWPSPLFTEEIQRALRRHRKGLRVLLRWSSIEVCASPTWHHPYWLYEGQDRHICEACQRLEPWLGDYAV